MSQAIESKQQQWPFDLSRDEVKDALRPVVLELVTEAVDEKLKPLIEAGRLLGSLDNRIL